MKCNKCGALNDEKQVYCVKCGSRLDGNEKYIKGNPKWKYYFWASNIGFLLVHLFTNLISKEMFLSLIIISSVLFYIGYAKRSFNPKETVKEYIISILALPLLFVLILVVMAIADWNTFSEFMRRTFIK